MSRDKPKFLSRRDRDKLQAAEEKQEKLRQTVKKTRKFTQTEQNALNIDSIEAFQHFWQGALDAKPKFDKRHEQGVGKVTKDATDFGSRAYDVLTTLNPMLDIIKDFGHPFGGMAVGTICFFLTVARTRVATEEKINSTLVEIQDRLPGVNMYKDIYNDDHQLDRQLQYKICHAYDCFVDFCIAAVEYCAQPSVGRLFHSLINDGTLDDKVSPVLKAVVDIRLLNEELQSKNVYELKMTARELLQQNVEILAQNSVLRQQIKELQRGYDVDNLQKVSQLLDLSLAGMTSRQTHLDQLRKHEKNVTRDFGIHNLIQTVSHAERLTSVEKDPEYLRWLESPDSGLFVLLGNNFVARASHCWLSPMAYRLIERKTTASPSSCVFYLLGQQETDDTCVKVMSTVILRLLSLNKTILRKEEYFTELCADLQLYQQLSRSSEDKSREMQALLKDVAVKVADMLDEEMTVWIMLDRVDKCRAAPSRRKTHHHHRRDGLALLRIMLHLVEQSKARIKVLAVVNRSDWHMEDDVDDLDQTREGSFVLLKCDQ